MAPCSPRGVAGPRVEWRPRLDRWWNRETGALGRERSGRSRAVSTPGDDAGRQPWIPVDGRDAGPEYPRWINPTAVVSASFWTDPTNLRVVTLELTTGAKVELRERKALDLVGRLTRGHAPEPAPVEPERVGCGRRA